MRRIDVNKKNLLIILCFILFSIFTLTIVYAALSVTLNIIGNAEVSAANWDIYLDNVQFNSNSATTTVPFVSNKTTVSFSTTLTNPGDFYEFTIDVVNNGSIDAMIDSVVKTPTLTTAQAKYLNYIVEYQNGEAISTKQLVSKNSFVRLKVKVEFRKDILPSDLPTQSETLDLSLTVNYIQSDDSSIGVTDNGIAKELILFAIEDVSYQAEKGMTWKTWISTSYNTDGYSITEFGEIGVRCYSVSYNGFSVGVDDIIIENEIYSRDTFPC